MYMEKLISVAIASYNGEKYIEEQLLSICDQTLRPDEIIVSDDGSKDATVEIVRRFSTRPEVQGIRIIILQDNPRHGYGGNFEWALMHSSGDYIFLCDQDDVWVPEKVEKVIEFFDAHPDADLVFHDAELIDKDGKHISGPFAPLLEELGIKSRLGEAKIGVQFCEKACSAPFINGMCMCITKALKERSIPFPLNRAHDHWLIFLATVSDSAFFLNQILAQYRLHGTNTCGSSAYRGSIIDKVKKWKGKIKAGRVTFSDRYRMGRAMLMYLENHYTDRLTPDLQRALSTAKRIVDIGEKEIDAAMSGKLSGSIKLMRLYVSDKRYRRSGTHSFLYQLADILLHSKKERIRYLSGEEHT